MIAKKDAARLRALDRELMTKFVKSYPRAKRSAKWQNPQLQSLMKRKGVGAPSLLRDLQARAERNGLFDVRLERHRWVDIDKARYVHTLARAAGTTMWPMGTHYWVRDNAIIGARFLTSSSVNRRKAGRELLLSGMNFMSSCAQLERFERIIQSRSRKLVADAHNWPHIFAGIKDNLSSSKPELWAHKQDAWQILVWHTLDALESGAIRLSELSAKNRRFLGLIVPFLAKVSFWECENSGSWEEIPAVRSSVRVWDHRLVVRLGELASQSSFRFLEAEFKRVRSYLGVRFRASNYSALIAYLDREATKVMLRDLPFESPGYKRGDTRYREADAALLYALELSYPEFLAERAGKSAAWARALEKKILQQVLSLQDERSGAIYRYANDSYQRSGFFRHLTVERLRDLYGAPSGDASSHFAGRDRVVPRGRKAAWTHFVWQLASWAGLRYERTGSTEYAALHERFFEQGLQLITQHSWTLDVDEEGLTRIAEVPAWRMPECYIADTTNSGDELVFPSPHTPLNWSTAEMLYAFEVRHKVLAIGVTSKARRAA
jgi:hypothetical protein